MNKASWLKFINRSKEAHHIREIFNGTFMLLKDAEVQDMFLNRIDRLLSETNDGHTKKSLEDLREDIELEIEHGEMRKAARPLIKTNGRPFSKAESKNEIQLLIDKLRHDLERLEDMIDASALRSDQVRP